MTEEAPTAGAATPTLSVVIPLYNEAEIVGELCDRVLAACRSLAVPFEVVLVDDGSRDSTYPQLVRESRLHPELRILQLTRNFGHMAALHAGLSSARGHAVVTMDGDLQDPPELIPELVAKWQQGADVVYAARSARHESLTQRALTRLFYLLLRRSSKIDIPAQAGTFGLLDRQMVDVVVLSMPERSRFFAGIRAWVGGRQEHITYTRPERLAGRSRVGLLGLFRLARGAIVSFSDLPLRAASGLAFLTSLIFLIIGITAISIRIGTELAIPGWASNMTLIGALGFVQSLVLFALAEYVAVIYEEVKRRPVSLILSETSSGVTRPARAAGTHGNTHAPTAPSHE